MAIEFACPNGHRLSCSDDRAGTQGKCPKCGVAFQVPNASTVAPNSPPPRNPLSSSSATGAAGGSASNGDSMVTSGGGKPAPTQIHFLCPSGHKLNGPLSLQGQPGQCPHCGMKFRIPFFDADDPEGSRISSSDDLEEGSELEELEEFEEVEELGEDEEEEGYHAPVGEQMASFLPPMVNEPDHSLAKLFPMLWNEKHHGAVLEIHLGEGITLIPDWWSERMSLGDHVLFALQTTDGSYVMESIPWDAIKRITVRRITELPGGVFD